MKNGIESKIKELATKVIDKNLKKKIEEVVNEELYSMASGIVQEILEKRYKEIEKMVFPIIKDSILKSLKNIELKRPNVDIEVNL